MSTEDVAKGPNDRPNADVVIADCGEVCFRVRLSIGDANNVLSHFSSSLKLLPKRPPQRCLFTLSCDNSRISDSSLSALCTVHVSSRTSTKINRIVAEPKATESTTVPIETEILDAAAPAPATTKDEAAHITGTKLATVTTIPDLSGPEPDFNEEDYEVPETSYFNMTYFLVLVVFVAIGGLLWYYSRGRFTKHKRSGSKGKYRRVDDDIEKQRD